MADVEVTIDASAGSISVKGDASFALEILEKYQAIFVRRSPEGKSDQRAATKDDPVVNQESEESKPGSVGVDGLDGYSNVYDVNGDAISIIANPPGTTGAAQARSVALLLLFAKFKTGQLTVDSEAIKEQLKAHACFDPKNFASQMKSQKNFVTVTGSKGSSSFTMKLTVPGRKSAEELVEKLQNEG